MNSSVPMEAASPGDGRVTTIVTVCWEKMRLIAQYVLRMSLGNIHTFKFMENNQSFPTLYNTTRIYIHDVQKL